MQLISEEGERTWEGEVAVSSCPPLASALLPYLGVKSAEQVCLSIPRAALIQYL
jgi:hypothetical protein